MEKQERQNEDLDAGYLADRASAGIEEADWKDQCEEDWKDQYEEDCPDGALADLLGVAGSDLPKVGSHEPRADSQGGVDIELAGRVQDQTKIPGLGGHLPTVDWLPSWSEVMKGDDH